MSWSTERSSSSAEEILPFTNTAASIVHADAVSDLILVDGLGLAQDVDEDRIAAELHGSNSERLHMHMRTERKRGAHIARKTAARSLRMQDLITVGIRTGIVGIGRALLCRTAS